MKYFKYTENLADFETQKNTSITPNVTYCTTNKELSWKKYAYNNEIAFVDLGLPSGRLWAACDIGSSTPSSQGSKFSWGELTTKQTYTEATYRWAKIDETQYAKYNSTDGKLVLDMEDDAARQILGGRWRLPSIEDVKELLANTTWTPGTSGVFTSKINGVQLTLATNFYFWLNALSTTNSTFAYAFYITADEGSHYREIGKPSRYIGINIRPVI